MMIKFLLFILSVLFWISPSWSQIETMDEESRIKLNQDLRFIERRIDELENTDVSSLGSPADDSLLLGDGSSWDITALPNCATSDSSILQYSTTSNSFSCSVQQSSGPEIFTSDGTFTAPIGITKIFITMCGGGGGGGGGDGGGGGGGGGGSGAECIIKYPYTVVPGNNYTVVVGAGGTGGVDQQAGVDGEDSVFNSAITVDGGNKGAAAAGAGGAAVAANTINASGTTGGSFGSFGGGSGADGVGNPGGDGGGGGASQLGIGGDGGTSGNGSNGSGYGSGGGGANDDAAGGNGAAGVVLIEY